MIGAFIWFMVAGIATACGVGGGGIYVPLGIILLRFASKPASGLSQASIFGASLGGFILNMRNQHPDTKIRDTVGSRDEEGKIVPYEKNKSRAEIKTSEEEYLGSNVAKNGSEENNQRQFYTRPLIDFDMALFLAPMEMAGAVLGVIVQALMPNWLFLSLAVLVLAVTSLKTYQKFSSSYKEDREKQEATILAEEEDDKSGEKSVGEGSVEDEMRMPEVATKAVEDNELKLSMRRKLLAEDARQYPAEKLFYLLILWVGLAIITFLKGGKGVESLVGITCKSPWFAIFITFQFLWTFGFAAVFGMKLLKRHELKVSCHYPLHQNDVMWDAGKLRFYASFTFVAGVVAGLIGIGGGMVLGPLMLVLGIHPRVSSATTATMIVLTSSSVAIMFVTSGLVPWKYALFFFCICFCGAIVGKKYIDAYVKRTGMASILIGILATIIALATIGCFVILLINLGKADWCFDSFKEFCVVKDKTDSLECLSR